MRSYVVLFLLISVILFSGCTSTENDDGKIDVVVSILPQKEFVKAVGGENVNVYVLIPPGASPATYDPSPQDLVRLENADVYFRVGHIEFEKSHVGEFVSMNPEMKVVDTSEGVTLRYLGEEEHHEHEEDHADEHDHQGVDPHIWLSPKAVVIQVENVYQALADANPENTAVYRKNADDYMAELNALDGELADKLGELETKKFIVFHPAWGYFADNYGLEQVAIEHEGKDPTADQLQHIIDEAKHENIKVVFVQEQFSTEMAESVAEEIQGVVVRIDPLAENYMENLREVGNTISKNLRN